MGTETERGVAAALRHSRPRLAAIGAGAWLLLTALIGACAGTPEQSTTGTGDSAVTAASTPGTTVAFDDKLVDVNGAKVAISCHGSGPKTVLFVGDVGQTGAQAWGQSGVPAQLGDRAVACTFDRPGLGRSEPGTQPRSVENQVSDLDALITSAGLTTPLVLVSQGYGTIIAREFAKDHRGSVSAMVLVDPPLWPFLIQMPAGASAGVKAEYGSLVQVDIDLGRYGAGALPPPPAPTIVLGTDAAKPALPTTAPAGGSLDGVAPTTTIQPLPSAEKRAEAQRQLSQKTPFGSYQQIDGAGSYAQYWKPDAVVAAIDTALKGNPPKR